MYIDRERYIEREMVQGCERGLKRESGRGIERERDCNMMFMLPCILKYDVGAALSDLIMLPSWPMTAPCLRIQTFPGTCNLQVLRYSIHCILRMH